MIINYQRLAGIRKKYQQKKIVFCSGTYDLLHPGHAAFFAFCKKQGDILVVAVGDDATIRKYKGRGRPILDQRSRLAMVDALKAVDYCLLDKPRPSDRVFLNEIIFAKLRPDVYVVNDDAFNQPYRKVLADRYGAKLVVGRKSGLKFRGLSTSSIIKKIVALPRPKK